MLKKFTIFLVTVLFLHNIIIGAAFAADYGTLTNETSKTVSPEVEHIQRSYLNGSVNRSVNILDIDLSNPYTSIELGLPNPINKLTRTSTIASNNSSEGHRVVGAINAAYFNSNGYPASLIALNNEILNFGAIGTGYESPTQQPVAFGISKDGVAIADYYTTNFTYAINGIPYKIDSINESRNVDSAVVYTEKSKTTGTNEWGREIIVENASQSTKNIGFGDTVTGTIKEITPLGKGNSEIPENGFVISANGVAISEVFDTAQVGDEVTITININEKWQDAQFMMAAGPLLVNNGIVALSMPTDASFAKSRHPRTAVGIDATGKKVFFVTVDGRQTGHSLGSNLQDLGEYMISLGANYAINLDGGGSTAMVVRELGTNSPVLVNKPSDAKERGVSAILQVINSAPPGQVKAIIPIASNYNVFVDDTITPTIKGGYDDYLNPVTITQSEIAWSVVGDIGYFDGSKFIATTVGTGQLVATLGAATVSIPVSVADLKIEPTIIHSFDSSENLDLETSKSTASLSNETSYTREGIGSVALTYDFTTSSEENTKAAYVLANNPIPIASRPDHLGVWVYGDGNKNWLRGVVVDAVGTKHTLDFTTQSGLNWTGWNYVTAKMPTEGIAPYAFERLYIVSPVASEWAKGKIYFDKLQAVYNKEHVELKYTDVAPDYWAFSTIERLNSLGLIKGYVDGTFKPTNQITRGEAAVVLAGVLQVDVKQPIQYKDVDASYYAYNAIQEVAAAGVITGRVAGKFDPNSQLSRAEMASIMDRMYKLTGTATMSFPDVAKNHWAHDSIMRLHQNGFVSGYPDGTFKPDNFITRAEFGIILSKAIK